MTRAIGVLGGAAVAGVLIWVAAQVAGEATWRYWAVAGLLAVGGLAAGLVRLGPSRFRVSPATFTLGFVPVLIVAGWVIAASSPGDGWLERHVPAWSSDIGVGGLVRDLGTFAHVLAFGVGFVLGLCFERSSAIVPAAPERAPAETAPESARTERPAREPDRPVADHADEDDGAGERRPLVHSRSDADRG